MFAFFECYEEVKLIDYIPGETSGFVLMSLANSSIRVLGKLFQNFISGTTAPLIETEENPAGPKTCGATQVTVKAPNGIAGGTTTVRNPTEEEETAFWQEYENAQTLIGDRRAGRLESLLRERIEGLFDDNHILYDKVLLRLVLSNPGGWVPISAIATVSNIPDISPVATIIVRAVKSSSVMEMNINDTHMRRRIPLPYMSTMGDYSVYINGFPLDLNDPQQEIYQFLVAHTAVKTISALLDLDDEFTGAVYADLESAEHVKRLRCSKLSFGGYPLQILTKSEFRRIKERERRLRENAVQSPENMSWQSYVDINLLGTRKITKAAIHGLDGGLWATSMGFSVTSTEIQALLTANDSVKEFTLNGTCYMLTRADEYFVNGYKHSDSTASSCGKSKKCVIITVLETAHRDDVHTILSDVMRKMDEKNPRKRVRSPKPYNHLYNSTMTHSKNIVEAVIDDQYAYYDQYLANAGNAHDQRKWANQLIWEVARHSIAKTIRDLREHIEEEEQIYLPKIHTAISAEESLKFGKEFQRTKHLVPTRFHPSAPDKLPFETLGGLLAAPLNKLPSEEKNAGRPRKEFRTGAAFSGSYVHMMPNPYASSSGYQQSSYGTGSNQDYGNNQSGHGGRGGGSVYGTLLGTDDTSTPTPAATIPPPADTSSSAHVNLGPLPSGWEQRTTQEGHPYFVDHDTRTTTWIDPRRAQQQNRGQSGQQPRSTQTATQLALAQQQSIARFGPLPSGWEMRMTNTERMCFLDHGAKITTWDDPRLPRLPGNWWFA
ncbi:hypothetical protein HK097_006184 [Rhizophlyctis rosea]|uniref:Profilin n=1 Tax=Rhizophlyctis rosea TaxID=64517 RepID=A0AAD5SJ43_9FUNG|nr:hypothetical protein HK097_006184 [Rhizophlyctis rosea]